jgi:hypothetical protein
MRAINSRLSHLGVGLLQGVRLLSAPHADERRLNLLLHAHDQLAVGIDQCLLGVGILGVGLLQGVRLLRLAPHAGEGGLNLLLHAGDQLAVGADQRSLGVGILGVGLLSTPHAGEGGLNLLLYRGDQLAVGIHQCLLGFDLGDDGALGVEVWEGDFCSEDFSNANTRQLGTCG